MKIMIFTRNSFSWKTWYDLTRQSGSVCFLFCILGYHTGYCVFMCGIVHNACLSVLLNVSGEYHGSFSLSVFFVEFSWFSWFFMFFNDFHAASESTSSTKTWIFDPKGHSDRSKSSANRSAVKFYLGLCGAWIFLAWFRSIYMYKNTHTLMSTKWQLILKNYYIYIYIYI